MDCSEHTKHWWVTTHFFTQPPQKICIPHSSGFTTFVFSVPSAKSAEFYKTLSIHLGMKFSVNRKKTVSNEEQKSIRYNAIYQVLSIASTQPLGTQHKALKYVQKVDWKETFTSIKVFLETMFRQLCMLQFLIQSE